MRYRLAAGQDSTKYDAGQFVSASYAARYPHKVAEVVIKEEIPIFEEDYEEMADYGDEWELTAYYDPDRG